MPHRGPPYTYEERPWQEPHWQRRIVGIVVWLSAMAIIAALMTIAIGVTTREAEPFEPLEGGVYSGRPVPLDRETVRPGDTLTVLILRCIDSDTPVLLFVSQRWERVDDPGAVDVPGNSTFAVREPGCREEQVTVTVPPDLAPGTWEMETINGALANTGAGIQVRTWRTAPVEVVP